VRILTIAVLDTSFDPAQFKMIEANLGRAGLENKGIRQSPDKLPIVLKSTRNLDVLPMIRGIIGCLVTGTQLRDFFQEPGIEMRQIDVVNPPQLRT
jgi:hypothetical protein